MKKIRLHVLILCISCCLAVYSNAQNDKRLKTIFSGILPDSFPDSIKTISLTYWNEGKINENYRLLPRITSAVVNRIFKFEFEIQTPVMIEDIPLVYNARFLEVFNTNGGDHFYRGFFIEPGDSIFVKLRNDYMIVNGKRYGWEPTMSTTTFSGRGADKYWCMQSIANNTRAFYDPKDTYNKTENYNNFKLADSINNMVVDIVRQYQSKISPVATSIIKATFISRLHYDISNIISGIYPIKGKEEPAYSQDESSKKLYKERLAQESKWIDVTDPYLIYADERYGFNIRRRAITSYMLDRQLPFSTHLTTQQVYDAIYKYIPKSAIKDKLLAGAVANAYDKELLSVANIIADNYLKNANVNDHFFNEVKRLREAYGNVSPGTPSFQFNLPDTIGERHFMKDFKGKVVLMDFMFTGCPGCKAMVPKLQAVEKVFGDNDNIAFISISIDKDQRWKSSGEWQYSVPGTLYLYTDNMGAYHPIIKYYNVLSYPKLVLIDKQGNLVTAVAPNPRIDDGKALIALIEEQLKK